MPSGDWLAAKSKLEWLKRGHSVKILQFCTNFYHGGGIQKHAHDLTDWLRAHGHEVTFAGSPVRSTIDPERDDFLTLDTHKVSRHDGMSLSRITATFREARKLRRYLSENPIDLIHTHETAPALVSKLATISMKIPIIMTFHGSEPRRIPQAAQIAKYCADLVASPSRKTLDALIANGVNARKTQIFGLGIDPLPETPDEEIARLRKLYLGEDGVMIFSPSRLAPQKGIDVMIEVAKRVTAKHKDAKFIVAGGGVFADEVDDWAYKAGVQDNMRFIGSIDTVPAHLRAADIFLLTSRWEALPISIVEAFRAGIPVIATDCGGVSELVDETVGNLCPVEDVEALTEAVLTLIESKAERADKGAAALERSYSSRFDSESVHSAIEAAYKTLLKA